MTAADTPRPLPIFIISFNRGAWLRKVIASYERQTTPVEILIHDNGSDDPATLTVLNELAGEGVQVFRRPAIHAPDELNKVNETIQEVLQARGEPSPYVVTDCDIDLSIARPEALQVYGELLERFPAAACVGPMLRIADIPRSYPLFNRVMNRHIDQFWRKKPSWAETSTGRAAYLEAPIDTTFALHRAGEPFCRLKPGLRVYHPYEAAHLDWYPAEHLTGAYPATSSAEITHWNNRDHTRRFATTALRFDSYRIVEENDLGELTVTVRRPSDNPA